MAISLQEQLLKSGVASKQQANKAKTAKRKQAKKQKGGQAANDQAARQAEIARAREEKAAHDRELNQKRLQEQEDKARQAEVRQLLDQHAETWSDKDASVRYQFAHDKAVKSMWVPQAVFDQLARGQLRIAFFDNKYRFVPRDIIERIESRVPGVILPLPAGVEEEMDDAYADYQIPDDLMW